MAGNRWTFSSNTLAVQRAELSCLLLGTEQLHMQQHVMPGPSWYMKQRSLPAVHARDWLLANGWCSESARPLCLDSN
jgi:hypothetical protein